MIYIASALTEAPIANLLANTLRAHQYEIASTWHLPLREYGARDPADGGERRAIIKTNRRDLDRASMLVAWTATGSPKACFAEIGYAIAQGKPVVWIQGAFGEGGCIFDADPLVVVTTEHGARPLLAAVRQATSLMAA